MPFDFEDLSTKDKQIAKIILQEIQDTLEGNISSKNICAFRNTYVINAQDSLDDSYPMYVYFNIISEMVKIVSVKVNFWIRPFRAYSTTVLSGGGHTTAAGGGHTTASGGGSTSGSQASHTHSLSRDNTVTGTTDGHTHTYSHVTTVSGSSGYHSHSTPNHQHAVADHQHAVADHVHALTFGIYEEDNSPTIKFYVSENEGVSYNDTFFGGYTVNQANLEITSLLTSAGSKLIKFESTARARLEVQIEIKLDIKAR